MTGEYQMELPVGRLPAWTRAECRVMVNKILGYERLVGWADTTWLLKGTTSVSGDNPGNPDTLYLPDCFYVHSLWRTGGYQIADTFYYEEWTLIGDPGLRVWTGPPRTISVTHPSWVSTGPQQFRVGVSRSGSPVSDAFACLWLDSTVYALDTTDTSGETILNITPDHPGRMRMTVTGRNIRPCEGTCEVRVPGEPFVTYLRHNVLDSFPAGNSDEQVGVGETIAMPVWLKNFGDSTSRSTSACLRMADPYVTLLDTVETFGTIASHDSARCDSGFRFFVARDCPEGRQLNFALMAFDSAGRSWFSRFSIGVTAAALVRDRDSIGDPGGDGNGRLDLEETADLHHYLRNDGSAAARQTSAILRSGDPRLVVLDSTGTWGDIPAWSTHRNTADHFTVAASNMVPATPIPCTLVISALCYSTRVPFTITVGALSAFDPIADGPRRPVRYWAFDNVDVRYPECPRYDWIEIRDRGTRLELGDNQTLTIDLPTSFGPFRYYDECYTQISICSDGWLAPGATTSSSWTNTRLQRNYGPPLLAPCWNNLLPNRGNNVWYLCDSTNHRFVVEWDSVHYRTPIDRWDKFQVVIYDTTLAAADGNTEFDFRYRTADNFRSATAGIQDPTGSIGISALVDTVYDVASARIVPGRCVRFTTDVPLIGISSPELLSAGCPSPSMLLHPNPCRGRVNLSCNLPGPVRLDLFDITGRSVLRADSPPLSSTVALDARHLPAGVYLCRLTSGTATAVQKLVIR